MTDTFIEFTERDTLPAPPLLSPPQSLPPPPPLLPSPFDMNLNYNGYKASSKKGGNPKQKPRSIVYSTAKQFSVKEEFEKIREDMEDYTNESCFEMYGHHIKMLCRLTTTAATVSSTDISPSQPLQANHFTASRSSNPHNFKVSRFSTISSLSALQVPQTAPIIPISPMIIPPNASVAIAASAASTTNST